MADTLAVALHDVEPATFERCMEIRTWLDERGVDRLTLLVIPARDLHPVGERSPALADWLAARRRLGDAIAQHGFQHEQLRRPSLPRRVWAPARARRAAEFAGLDDEETRRAVEAGWRLMKLAGIEPHGFVAPAYAYTPALRRAVSARFRWWASLLSLHGVAEPAESRPVPGDGMPALSNSLLAPTRDRLVPVRRRLIPALGPTLDPRGRTAGGRHAALGHLPRAPGGLPSAASAGADARPRRPPPGGRHLRRIGGSTAPGREHRSFQ